MSDYNYGTDTILIVDDEPNNLKVLYNLLTEHDYEVRAARDGQTAITAAQDDTPDLILLDIKMPQMDGYEVCRRLKADPNTAAVPVIFISALNQVTDIVEAFQVGGVDYITKPFQFEEVLARVHTHLTLMHQGQHLALQKEQIEAMRRKDRERFKKVAQMRENFVRAAAHDLKNPLGIVMGYADMMLRMDTVRSDPRLRRIAEEIGHSSDNMLDLVTDMLEIMHLQSLQRLTLEDVEWGAFLEEELHKHQLHAHERDIEIELVKPQAVLYQALDKQHMQRALDNLVSNAIKYSPNNTTVTVQVTRDDEAVALEVRDEGYGIAQEMIHQLFDPFFRAPLAGKRIEGTGLGLAIVKEIVEQHGGHISVESQLGHGSTFRVHLPTSVRYTPAHEALI